MKYLNKPKVIKNPLILSEIDYYRLLSTIQYEKQRGKISSQRLNRLRHRLKDINLYPIRWFPVDVVSMNSVFELTVSGAARYVCRLVYPEEANFKQRQISVFSSLGMRILGRRTGDTLRSGKLRIGKILYQPELYDRSD